MMAFNAGQFKQKKKRAVDPNAPPRPNLMSHDKTIREGQMVVERLMGIVERQQTELERLRTDYKNMQQSVEQIISIMRRNK